MAIWRALDERGLGSPAAVGKALGMPAAAATGLLARHQWRDGDVALLRAAAARLGSRCQAPADLRAPPGQGAQHPAALRDYLP